MMLRDDYPHPPRARIGAPPAVRGADKLVQQLVDWLAARRCQPWQPAADELLELRESPARLPASTAQLFGVGGISAGHAVRILAAEAALVEWIRDASCTPGAPRQGFLDTLLGHVLVDVPADVAAALELPHPSSFAAAVRRAREIIAQ